MASSARIDEIKKKFDENPRRYFAPLANEFRKAGDLEQAIIICEEFLPQQAGHMSGHIVYGQALFESGRLPESRTVFETALGLDPENLIALRHLGDIAQSQGEMGAARQWYDRVLEADPRNEEIQGIISGLSGGGAGAGSAAGAEDTTLVMEAISAPLAQPGPPPELAAIDLDMDADFGLPAGAAPAAPPPPLRLDERSDALTLDGLQPTNAESATAAGMPDVREARAEGLEPSEFEAPTDRHARAAGLEPAEFEAPSAAPPRADGLQTSEFASPGASSSVDDSLMDLETSFAPGSGSSAVSNVAPLPLDGLEPTGATQPPARESTTFPPMELESGTPRESQVDSLSAIGAMPVLDAEPAEDALSGAAQAERSLDGLPMMELTPAVIDAESKLMDAGQSYGSSTPGGRDDGVSGNQPPFVTETMADLYLKQGFREQALDVYRQLASASPADARLAARVEQLQRAGAESQGGTSTGPTVREFFHRLATRRPGDRAAEAAPPAADDFAPAGSAAAVEGEDWSTGITESSGASTATALEAPASTRETATFGLPMYDDAPIDSAPEAEVAAVAPSSWDFAPAPRPAHHDDAAAAAVAIASTEGDAAAEPLPDWEPTPMPAAADASAGAAHRDPEPAAMPMPSAAERGATAQGGAASGGTIDALFGTRSTGRSEDSAASALAQAFGGSYDAPAITGRPARAAANELSLDSVFRDGPARAPRASQSFSFDQFFSESATTGDAPAGRAPEVAPAGEPAERSADDIQQFNSWLQGLKQR